MLRALAVTLLMLQAAAPAAPTYLFSYFTGNGEDGLHFAASADGLQWSVVAGGRSFLAPAVGSRLLRDPSIVRGKHLRVVVAKRPEGPWGVASAPISIDWVEGPSVLQVGSLWVVYYDEYTRRRYGAIASSDWVHWEPLEVSFPAGTRHGTSFRVDFEVSARFEQKNSN